MKKTKNKNALSFRTTIRNPETNKKKNLFFSFLFWIPASIRLRSWQVAGMTLGAGITWGASAFAALIPCPDGTQADPVIGCVKTPQSIIQPQSDAAAWVFRIATWFSAAVAVATVIGIIWSGIQYATAMGDEEKIQKAKQGFFWSVFGLAISGLAFGVVTMANNLLS